MASWLVPTNHPRYPGQPALEWATDPAWRAGLGQPGTASQQSATSATPVLGVSGELPAQGSLTVRLPGPAVVEVLRETAIPGGALPDDRFFPGSSTASFVRLRLTVAGQTSQAVVMGGPPRRLVAGWVLADSGAEFVAVLCAGDSSDRLPSLSSEWPGRPAGLVLRSREFGAGNTAIAIAGSLPDPAPVTLEWSLPAPATETAGWFGRPGAAGDSVAFAPDAGGPRSRWSGGFASSLHRAAALGHASAGISSGRQLAVLDAVGHPELGEQYLPRRWLWLTGALDRTALPFLPAAHAAYPGEGLLVPPPQPSHLSADTAANARLTRLRIAVAGDMSGDLVGNPPPPGVIFDRVEVEAAVLDGAFNEYVATWTNIPRLVSGGFEARQSRAVVWIHRHEAGNWDEATDPDAATHEIGLVIRIGLELRFADAGGVLRTCWVATARRCNEATAAAVFAGQATGLALPASGAGLLIEAIGP
jgi:hypothetical protein